MSEIELLLMEKLAAKATPVSYTHLDVYKRQKWEWLTDKEVKMIKNRLIAGFFPFTFHDSGIDFTIEAYRGTLTKEHYGYLGDGNYYYRTVSVDVIQR